MATDAPHGVASNKMPNQRIAERRKRERLPAQWPVRLWRDFANFVEALTLNVSSHGLYCRCPQPFSAGERVIAFLEIPIAHAGRECHRLVLRCEVYVLWVEALIDRCEWGLGCEILDYSVARDGIGQLNEMARNTI
jgi:hypothetical protein